MELLELLEEVDSAVFKELAPALEKFLIETYFSLEDLETLCALPHAEASSLLRMANPPSECDAKQVLEEFREASDKIRLVLFHSCLACRFLSTARGVGVVYRR